MSQTQEFVLPFIEGDQGPKLPAVVNRTAHQTTVHTAGHRTAEGDLADGAQSIVGVAEAIVAASAAPDTAAAEQLLSGAHPKHRFASWSRRYVRAAAVTDAAIGAFAVGLPLCFSNQLSGTWWHLVLTVVGAIAWPLAISLARGYEPRRIGIGTDELRPPLHAAIALIVAGAFPAGLANQTAMLKLIVVAVPFAVVLAITARFLMRKHLHHAQADGRRVRHVIVLGSAPSVASLASRLTAETHAGMKVVGACTPGSQSPDDLPAGVPVLGDLADAAQIVRSSGCDAVAVTSDDQTRHQYLRELSWALEGSGVEMLVDPGLLEIAGPRMHVRPLVGFPLLHIAQPRFTGAPRTIKRAFDIVATTVGLTLISPVLVVIALAVKLGDGGPVLFKQERVGRDGRPFMMLKFRSMVVDAEARKAALVAQSDGGSVLFKMANDPRITRIGRVLRDFSLDELPQLFNVLAGSMSLVGPRPHLDHEVAAMPSEAVRRSLVTPGLTGMWQVSGRSDLSADEAVRLDLRYVENWSLTLDLLILWKTVFTVLAKKGAR